MTRRKFLKGLISAGLLAVSGLYRLTKKAVPRRFIYAVRTKKYPGKVKSLADITKYAKWSG